MMRTILTALLCGVLLGSPGCSGHRSREVHEEYAPASHVCTPACFDHYYDGERLIILKGHRHKPGCGHVWEGHYWILAEGHVHAPPPAHVCTPDCFDHYYDGERLIILKGHRHGPGCGHVWKGQYWVALEHDAQPPRPAHVCTRDCNEHYFNGERLVVLKGHRHGPGCGHVWKGRYWVVADDESPRHVCTHECQDHYYNGRRLITLKNHHHGQGCGHFWNGQYWVAAR